jgi:chromate transport protein ChrA
MPLTEAATENQRLRELAGLFLKLGLTAFGGPAALYP